MKLSGVLHTFDFLCKTQKIDFSKQNILYRGAPPPAPPVPNPGGSAPRTPRFNRKTTKKKTSVTKKRLSSFLCKTNLTQKSTFQVEIEKIFMSKKVSKFDFKQYRLLKFSKSPILKLSGVLHTFDFAQKRTQIFGDRGFLFFRFLQVSYDF